MVYGKIVVVGSYGESLNCNPVTRINMIVHFSKPQICWNFVLLGSNLTHNAFSWGLLMFRHKKTLGYGWGGNHIFVYFAITVGLKLIYILWTSPTGFPLDPKFDTK